MRISGAFRSIEAACAFAASSDALGRIAKHFNVMLRHTILCTAASLAADCVVLTGVALAGRAPELLAGCRGAPSASAATDHAPSATATARPEMKRFILAARLVRLWTRPRLDSSRLRGYA